MTKTISAARAAKTRVLPTHEAQAVARVFQILADPTRVRMIKALAEAEWCVSDLTRALEMDQPAVSHQLKYLRDLGLVRWRKSGRHVYYRLGDTPLLEMLNSHIAQNGDTQKNDLARA